MRALLSGVLLLAACASPASRIKAKQEAFDAYPPAVQSKISEGRVEVGFTREQTSLALGRPSRIYTNKSDGAEQEIWVYGSESRRGSVGLGMGMGGGAFGGGVGLASGDGRGERARVVFQGDSVVSVEQRRD